MILSNKTKVKLSLTDYGKKFMDNNLNQRLDLLYKLVDEIMQAPPDIRANIDYAEHLRLVMLQDSFELPYTDFVTIFGDIVSDSIYIKGNKLEILEENDE